MSISYVEIARKVELFRGISPEDIAKIFARGMTVRVLQGEVVFYQGTVGSQMYVVLAGTMGIYDGKKRIAKLATGDMLGEMALVNKEPRSATAIAEEDSLLFVLSETTFQKLLTKTVAIKMLLNIVHAISRRLRDANALVARLSG